MTVPYTFLKKRITILLMNLAQTEEQKYQSTIYLVNILMKLKEKGDKNQEYSHKLNPLLQFRVRQGICISGEVLPITSIHS